MAAERLRSAISSMFLISRASSMTCWPSATLSPAFSSSNIIGGSMISTPIGILSQPASRMSEAISSAWRFISPNDGDTVPRSPIRPALQFSGLSHGT